ncbi:MAG: hypothetical protein A2Y23_02600 [Clostridiales bacterium GWB2_37_7]|nr:MAG: hypothetical protein A2Y23_02600 [Clostridiales bacterium GWB2_37_7]
MENIKENLSEEIKNLICKLPDIKHCSVVCSQDNVVEEIHALAGVSRNIKQLVRDIQSAINARFGINIDYKVISIAQIDESDFKETRLKLDGISVNNIENSIEATVTLKYDDKLFEGKSRRIKSRSNKLKAIADATLLALEGYLDIGQAFYLEDMQIVLVANRELFACVIGFALGGKEELLSGCSIINADENETVVKAVLSAVNRKISTMS